jgi:hypothetical protein
VIWSIFLASILLFSGQDVANLVKLPPPGVQYRADVATATSAPWVNANGWRIQREPGKKFYYDLPIGAVLPAMAESHAYNADVVVKVAPGDEKVYQKMNAFLSSLAPAGKQLGNIAVMDDGSAQAGEAMNLLHRKNLLYRIVTAPDPKADLNIKADKSITNPLDFAQDVRQKLTDEKRMVRVYGSEVVLANLTGDSSKPQLHVINYGKRPIEGLRLRVRGLYKVQRISNYDAAESKVEDFTNRDGGTEFTIPHLDAYAVIDLQAK